MLVVVVLVAVRCIVSILEALLEVLACTFDELETRK